MDFSLVRTLRTASSERYLLQKSGDDFGALDLHFLNDGTVSGTLILFRGHDSPSDFVSAVLSELDEKLLPMVELGRNLSFTVVAGHVIGNFQPTQETKQ